MIGKIPLNRPRWIVGWLSALCWLAMALACATPGPKDTGQYGSLDRNREVTDLFTSSQVLPDHRYYYSGPDAYPSVAIAIDKDYTLTAEFWKPIEMTPGTLNGWNGWARETLGLDYYRLMGSYILGPRGQRIGVWFPFRNRLAWGRIILNPDRTVNITTPGQDGPGRLRVLDRRQDD